MRFHTGRAIAQSYKRLRAVAGGCERLRTVAQHPANKASPPDPQDETRTLCYAFEREKTTGTLKKDAPKGQIKGGSCKGRYHLRFEAAGCLVVPRAAAAAAKPGAPKKFPERSAPESHGLKLTVQDDQRFHPLPTSPATSTELEI